MELYGKRILLGVSGGIAAYKVAELSRLLVKAGVHVQVTMSEAATRFVTPVTFQALTGHSVFVDQWDARIQNNMPHIDLTRGADAMLIAPASADFLAKLSHGMADDLLSTMTLARDCPLLVAPAMNRQMWENPSTRRNVLQLQDDGVTFIGPGRGDQACGENGLGRMLEPEEILDEIRCFFYPKRLLGKRILITAGPTFEAIDPVRGITNLSSGKMGFALARAARHAGAEVTLVTGPVSLETPIGVQRVDVVSALDMHEAVMSRVKKSDIFIGVAAVADYRVANPSEQKLKKTAGAPPAIELVQNPDILAEVAALANGPFCVGFAAESENLETYAQEKRRRKNIPLIVGNLIQDGFGGNDNRLVLFDDAGSHSLPPASKAVLAQNLIDHISSLIQKRF